MSGGAAPKAPDYVGAAKAQGQSNIEAALQSAYANNPNVNNPYGSQAVTWETSTGTPARAAKAAVPGHYVGKGKARKWVPPVAAVAAKPATKGAQKPTITQTLAPAQQALLDKSNASKANIGDAAIASSDLIKSMAGRPLDFSQLPGAPKDAELYRQDVIDAMMGRVNTDYGNQQQDENSSLIAAGLRPGTAAYETAMDRLNRGRNDARQQAIIAGGSEAQRAQQMGLQTRQQAISELMSQRQTPLNEFNALQSGSQMSNPFGGNLGFQAGTNVAPAPIAAGIQQQGQSAMNQYNQQQANANGNMNAGAGLLGSLGQGYLSRPG
jgi:hypothetical protein